MHFGDKWLSNVTLFDVTAEARVALSRNYGDAAVALSRNYDAYKNIQILHACMHCIFRFTFHIVPVDYSDSGVRSLKKLVLENRLRALCPSE